MKVKEWIKEHKKLVIGIGVGTAATVGLGLIFKFVIHEDDIDVDPIVVTPEITDKVMEAYGKRVTDETLRAIINNFPSDTPIEKVFDMIERYGFKVTMPYYAIDWKTGTVDFTLENGNPLM